MSKASLETDCVVLSDGRQIHVHRMKFLPEVGVATVRNPNDGRHHPKLDGVVAEADVALEAWARWGRMALSGFPASTVLARVIEFGILGAAARLGVTTAVEVDQLCEMVERIVMKLEEIDRLVIILHYLRWQPIDVSAKQCSMEPTTFRKRLSNARREVGHRLEGIKIAWSQNTM